jgi:hypothetical protein
VQQKDAAFALVLDEVGRPGVDLAVQGGESANHGFDGELDLWVEDEVFEGLPVVGDVGEVGDADVAYCFWIAFG